MRERKIVQAFTSQGYGEGSVTGIPVSGEAAGGEGLASQSREGGSAVAECGCITWDDGSRWELGPESAGGAHAGSRIVNGEMVPGYITLRILSADGREQCHRYDFAQPAAPSTLDVGGETIRLDDAEVYPSGISLADGSWIDVQRLWEAARVVPGFVLRARPPGSAPGGESERRAAHETRWGRLAVQAAQWTAGDGVDRDFGHRLMSEMVAIEEAVPVGRAPAKQQEESNG
jgi:hypothetical protein